MSDDERISEIRDIHVAGVGIGAHACANCYDEWPCDTAYLLARVDALTAERDYLVSCFDELMKAGKSQRDRADKAESERDALRISLRWAEQNTTHDLCGHGSNMLRMCRVCDQVGERDQINHAPDCPFAALAARGGEA